MFNKLTQVETISSISLAKNNMDVQNLRLYYPIQFLDKNIQFVLPKYINNVNLCIFTINNESNPYITYMLSKVNDKLYWPHFKPTYNIQDECNEKLNILGVTPSFEGFKKINNVLYVFYYIDKIKPIKHVINTDSFWWTTMYEISLSRQVLNFKLHPSVFNLFTKEPRLQYLCDENGKKYENSSIAYASSSPEELNYIVVNNMSRYDGTYGNFYYFNDLNTSINKSDGIIYRYIVNIGKQKVIINEQSREVGNWYDIYDSLLINNNNIMTLVVQNISQIDLLSYHYIKNNTIL